ncbi:hypothetical protein [Dyella sp. GSA-30]|uniref:hypothetical protein n=1 Tax=Dyella sp. GSA-30 TaxID=2994496 RepID=UPI002490BBC8|nr:hypothetical protein [Dyella sp. GSA-30]
MQTELRLPMRWVFAFAGLGLLNGQAMADGKDFNADCTDGVRSTYRAFPELNDPPMALNVENTHRPSRTTISKKSGKIVVTWIGADFEIAQAGDGWKQATLWDDAKQLAVSVERPGPHPSIATYRLDIFGATGVLTTTIMRFGQSMPDVAAVSAEKCVITY